MPATIVIDDNGLVGVLIVVLLILAIIVVARRV